MCQNFLVGNLLKISLAFPCWETQEYWQWLHFALYLLLHSLHDVLTLISLPIQLAHYLRLMQVVNRGVWNILIVEKKPKR